MYELDSFHNTMSEFKNSVEILLYKVTAMNSELTLKNDNIPIVDLCEIILVRKLEA